MKHTIVLFSILLTACGSNGGGGTVSTSNTQPEQKRVLYITDVPQGSTLAQDLSPGLGGTSVVQKNVDSYTDYQALDGTQLRGALSQLSQWLAAEKYDAIVLVIGQQEYEHEYKGYPCYCRQMDINAHASTFMSNLLNDPNRPETIVMIRPEVGGANFGGPTSWTFITDAASGSGTRADRVLAAISKLSQALQ